MSDSDDVPTQSSAINIRQWRVMLPALVFSLGLAIAVVLGAKIDFKGDPHVYWATTYEFGAIHLTDALWVILVAGVAMAFAVWLPRLVCRVRQAHLATFVPAPGRASVLMNAVVAIGLMLAWSPVWLTFAPGGVNPDAKFSVEQALYAGSTAVWNNHHPVFYALSLRPLLALGIHLHSIDLGIALSSAVQYLVVALALAYALTWLARKGIPVVFLALTFIFFAFDPVFPVFAVALSQDTYFAVLIVLYTLHIARVVESGGEYLTSKSGLAVFAVLSLLIIFCRNNGFVVVGGVGLAIALAYRAKLRAFYAVLAGIVVATAMIVGPVYKVAKVSQPVIESLGVPLQQMAYVVTHDGHISAADRRTLEAIMPMSSWKMSYEPYSADGIKAVKVLRRSYLARHMPGFMVAWVSIVVHNPGDVVKAYLLETFGYWKPVIGTMVHFNKPGISSNTLGIHGVDLIERVTGHSIKQPIESFLASDVGGAFANVALAVWLAFLSAVVLIALGRPKFLVILAPVFFSWLGIMLAAPIAVAPRYLLMYIFCLPLIVLLPLLAANDVSVCRPPRGAV